MPVPNVIFKAVDDTQPREDREMKGQVFARFGADRLRSAITRACKSSGVPTFSPHDLRHRRASLWHLQGVPAAEAVSWPDHSAQEHLRTYARVVIDRTEVDYANVLRGEHTVRAQRLETPVCRVSESRMGLFEPPGRAAFASSSWSNVG